ncbi:hypothetical protein [Nocardioides bruguierae]|uniref:Aromatic ring-opening dioxygenase LigA n=1 Tax=Nocardioides bruguierae TaxID=2945102 RepID=A0A9X2IF56_9ACTN|nr:hypothetical protein [Nocardioides bruguierae]MCL8025137.1 hypothetical protein [Nocardioides bruguierae]MCM0620049.1 hypothetical protein [Nocardioides bruguierae]
MRSLIDRFASIVGVALAAVLLVAGGLLSWASSFIGDQVNDQLSMQGITMPTEEAIADMATEDREALEPFAGQPLDNGPAARAYADHYILVHMNAASDGRTYEEVSGEYVALSDEEKATEEGQALGALRQTLFMGNTLRGLLLYGFAFATIGTIAGYASIAAFVGAGIMVVLTAAGLRHAKRLEAAEEKVDSPQVAGV